MIDRDELLNNLNHYLKICEFKDYCPNGMQVEGKEVVTKIAIGVSTSRSLIERAIELNADLIIVHHGLIWRSSDPVIRGWWKERLKLLLLHDITLAAYHLPLDAHPEVGNNYGAARELGLLNLEPFGEISSTYIGVKGVLPKALSPEQLAAKLHDYYGQPSLSFTFGPDTISSLALISGGASGEFHQAIRERVDCYVTGEPAEWTQNTAREAGVHFFAVGHYNSEKIGIRKLGDKIRMEYGIPVEFIDIPNPV